jgi:hypothetical protein
VSCVFVASFHVAQVLETLVELDREFAAVVRVASASPLDRTLASLRSAAALAVLKLTVLHERALEHAALTTTEAQIANLRACTNVVLHSLARLEPIPLPPQMFAGKLKSLRDVKAFLFDQLGRVNAQWFREQRNQPGSRLLQVTLENAESALRLFSKDLDLAHFVRIGASSSVPSIRLACCDIGAVIGLDEPAEHADATPTVVEVRIERFSATPRTPADGFQP